MYGNNSIITRVLRESRRWNRCASPLLLPCIKEWLKIDGGHKNNLITCKVALTDKIEKTTRTKEASSTANKYKSKQEIKTIEEELKELEQKKKPFIIHLNAIFAAF